MKRCTLICMFIFTLMGITAQNSVAVKISYVMNKTNPPSYTFSTDFTGEAVSYLWYFGDEGKSEQVSPTYSFKYTKNYVVNVKILGKNNEVFYGKLEGAFEGAGIITTTCKAYFTFGRSITSDNTVSSKKITFTSQSSGEIKECKWSFGDGQTSTEKNPVHEYASFGEYKVCLIITTTNGCKSDYCTTVKLADPAQPVILTAKGYVKDKSAIAGCGLVLVLENGTVLLPVELAPGIVLIAGQYVEFTFEVLSNTATTCQAGKAVKIHRLSQITANTCKAYFIFSVITSSDTDNYDKKKVSFTNKTTGDIAKCVWTFGDGTESTDLNPVHVYTAYGEYKVCLYITATNGCTSSYCTTVKLADPSVPVILSGKGYVKEVSDIPGCRFVIVLENGTILNPVMMVQNFLLVTGQKVELAYEILASTVTTCQTGKPVKVHKIAEIQPASLCKAYFTATNDLWSNPAMMKKMVFSNLSTGDIKECKWTFGDGTTGTELRPVHEYPAFGEYKVCLYIVTASGCKSEYCAMVVVDDGVTDPACNFDLIVKRKEQTNNTFVFYAVSRSEIKAWKWSFGDGVTNSDQNPEHTYEKPGSYEVTCTIVTSTGCTATRTTKVTISEPPLPSCPGALSLTLFEPGPDLSVCNGKAIVSLLDGAGKPVGNVTYGWSNGMTGEEATGLCPNKQYIVKALIPGVCQKHTSFAFLTSPVWKVTKSDGIFGFSVQTPADSIIYRWDFGDGNFAFGSSVEYDFENEGIYDVTLTAISGSYTNGSSQKVAALDQLTHITELTPAELKVYPNPAKDLLTIEFGKIISGNLDIDVLNMSGQKVMARKIAMNGDFSVSLETSTLSTGVYLLRIKQENQILQGIKFQKTK